MVKISLNGTAPEVSSTGNYTIIRATWYDYAGDTVDEETVEATIVNPSDIDGILETRRSELASLKSYIDEKSGLGVDTGSAEKKYNVASGAIEEAEESDSAAASILISSAKTYIDESCHIDCRCNYPGHYFSCNTSSNRHTIPCLLYIFRNGVRPESP